MPASAWLCRYCDVTGTQGFTHQLQPLVRSQSQHVCFIHGGTLAGAKCTWAHKLFILHLQKKTNHENIVLPKKSVKPHKSSQLPIILPETLSKQFTLVGTKCLLNSQRVLAEALFPEKHCSSRDLRQAHCATSSLTLLVYLSTVPLFCTFYAVLLVSYKCTWSMPEEASGYFYSRSIVLYICRMRLLFRD